jgi:CheY-like chemotaxis protein
MKVILIVDDEIDITSVLTMLLEHEGFGVLSASNGLAALEVLTKHTPDLIISDCMMPIMDGIRFLNTVRKNHALDSVPFVLMSGAPEQHNLTNAKFDIFLKKPFLYEDLMIAIKPLLGLDG